MFNPYYKIVSSALWVFTVDISRTSVESAKEHDSNHVSNIYQSEKERATLDFKELRHPNWGSGSSYTYQLLLYQYCRLRPPV